MPTALGADVPPFSAPLTRSPTWRLSKMLLAAVPSGSSRGGLLCPVLAPDLPAPLTERSSPWCNRTSWPVRDEGASGGRGYGALTETCKLARLIGPYVRVNASTSVTLSFLSAFSSFIAMLVGLIVSVTVPAPVAFTLAVP